MNIKIINKFLKVKKEKFLNKKQNNITQKRSDKKIIILIIVTILSIIFLYSKTSFGKQISNVKINTNCKIARPILIVENNPEIDITNKNSKGYYDFKIKNYNDLGEVNQINLKYNIEILNKENKAITFKLYKGSEELELENNQTKDMIMKSDEKQEENYKLEILYNKSSSNSLEDIIQDVQIKVHSEQLKA